MYIYIYTHIHLGCGGAYPVLDSSEDFFALFIVF